MPISHCFRDCEALLVMSLSRVRCAIANPRSLLFVCPMLCICIGQNIKSHKRPSVRPSVRRLWTRMWRNLWTDFCQIWIIGSPYLTGVNFLCAVRPEVLYTHTRRLTDRHSQPSSDFVLVCEFIMRTNHHHYVHIFEMLWLFWQKVSVGSVVIMYKSTLLSSVLRLTSLMASPPVPQRPQ